MRRTGFRRWFPLLFVAATALLALSWFARTKSPLDRFRERISIGSTRAEVEDALGGPPGDYKTREVFPFPRGGGTEDYWSFNHYDIIVGFDMDDRVTYFDVDENVILGKPWWERIFTRR